MSSGVLLFSTDLVKWSADKFSATVSFNLYGNETTFSHSVDLYLNNIPEAVNVAKKSILEEAQKVLQASEAPVFRDDEIITKALETSFGKTKKELQSNKNGKGKGRSSITRYNLFYLKEPEINLLSDQENYLAYIDIIDRKAAKDQYGQVGSYIQEALKLNPEDDKLLLYQAKFLLATHKKEEAVKFFEKYAATKQDDIDVLTEFARLCDNVNDFKKADKVYNQIIKLEPENLDALARKAQIKYYKKQKFETELDKIRKIDFEWLKDHIKKRWDFHLPDAKQDLNPLTAAKFLGLSKPIEVAALVVSKDIPAYYNEKASKMMFSQEELQQWFNLVERYELNENNITLA